jgi:hypothetical protein
MGLQKDLISPMGKRSLTAAAKDRRKKVGVEDSFCQVGYHEYDVGMFGTYYSHALSLIDVRRYKPW